MMMLRSKSSSESSKKGFSESSASPKRFNAKETEPNTTTKGSGFGAVRRIREVDFSGNARNEYVNPIEEEEEEEEEEEDAGRARRGFRERPAFRAGVHQQDSHWGSRRIDGREERKSVEIAGSAFEKRAETITDGGQ